MKILELSFKNFSSYGNKIQKIDFDPTKSELYLCLGQNGSGKCLDPDTLIEVNIEDEIIKEKFLFFLKDRNLPTPL